MRTIITLNKNRQDAATEIDQSNTPQNPSSRSAGQPVIQVRQNKLNKQHQPYSEHEHQTVALNSWSGSNQAAQENMQPAEEDMYDPDLAVDYTGTRGYMLQPG
jgi:hypothetical protein